MKLYIYTLKKRKKFNKDKTLAPYHMVFFVSRNDKKADKHIEEIPPFKYYNRFLVLSTSILKFLFYTFLPFDQWNIPKK